MNEERQTKRYVKVMYQFLLLIAMLGITPCLAIAGYINSGISGMIAEALIGFVPMMVAFICVTLADEKGYVEN